MGNHDTPSYQSHAVIILHILERSGPVIPPAGTGCGETAFSQMQTKYDVNA